VPLSSSDEGSPVKRMSALVFRPAESLPVVGAETARKLRDPKIRLQTLSALCEARRWPPSRSRRGNRILVYCEGPRHEANVVATCLTETRTLCRKQKRKACATHASFNRAEVNAGAARKGRAPSYFVLATRRMGTRSCCRCRFTLDFRSSPTSRCCLRF
jgi:hypothetical protein